MLNLTWEKEILDINNIKGNFSKSNKAYIKGVIEDELEFSHKAHGEKFYKTRVEVKRDSGVADYIPVLISEREIDLKKLSKGIFVEIAGQFRSYFHEERAKNKLELFLFVKSIKIIDNGDYSFKNLIFLDGYISSKPNFRITPIGKEITCLFIAENGKYHNANYIPAIAWGKRAYYTRQLKVGDRIQIEGRIQSKIYTTKNFDGEERESYEISIFSLEKFNE